MAKLTKVKVVVEGVDDKGKRFKDSMVFEGEIDGNWEHQLGTATGWKLGGFAPADIRPTGESQFSMFLRIVNQKKRSEYVTWAATMHSVREAMG